MTRHLLSANQNGIPVFNLHNAKEEINRLVAEFGAALGSPVPTRSVPAVSFSILSLCAALASAKLSRKVREEIGNHAGYYVETCKMGPAMAVMDLMRVFVPLLKYADRGAGLGGHLPVICLSLWQSALDYLERDADLNPYTLIDPVWNLYIAVDQGPAQACAKVVSIIADEVLTRTSMSAPSRPEHAPCFLSGFDLLAALYKNVDHLPIGNYTRTLWENVRPSDHVERAALTRLEARRRMFTEKSIDSPTELCRIEARIAAINTILEMKMEHSSKIIGPPRLVSRVATTIAEHKSSVVFLIDSIPLASTAVN
jgi:hypothetical protein